MEKWQQNWEKSDKGRWTYRLIPEIKEWCDWGPRLLNFHLTQVLTGHGCFGTFLKKIGRQREAQCWFCPEREDSPEHFLFACSRWRSERAQLCSLLHTEFNKEHFVKFLREEATRSLVTAYITRTLKEKEDFERKRQRA
ncbi:uncharacterized protein LOC123988002 [Osmia bicornis bicornis]|uniref:uncharacterized protein LOC123988002 n=1 Tax=Osmia bicornis bicornis TaxID=1437191 RepID=UPI001EAEEAFD|nr:uncharacterized protein LOC123988002 [Osmia bicornis bicornis]